MGNTDCVGLNTVRGMPLAQADKSFTLWPLCVNSVVCYPSTRHFSLYIFMHILEKLMFHITLPQRNALLWYFSHISSPQRVWSCSVSTTKKPQPDVFPSRETAQDGSLIEIEMSDWHQGCKQSSPGGGRPPAERKPDSVTYHPPLP